MRYIAILLMFGAALWCNTGLAGAQAPDIMTLEEIEPGMRGIALTVLFGTEPDSLPLEIISVMPGYGPGRHMILVKGLGEFENTGIASGMSGSPVFIDGRLIGALAFAFNGALDPIGGVTPIGDMNQALDEYFNLQPSPRSYSGDLPEQIQGDLPAFPDWRSDAIKGDVMAVHTLLNETEAGSMEMSRIKLPLQIANATPAALQSLQECFSGTGLEAVAAGSQPGGSDWVSGDAADLGPGDAMCLHLISGDMNAVVIGTVTWVDGDHVLAFGHPFMSYGTTELPMGKARIHGIVPNRNVSFKMGTPVNRLGSMIADRNTGVAAIIGTEAKTVPLDLTIHCEEAGNWKHNFHFDIAVHEMLTPALMTAAVSSTLNEQTFGLGLGTVASEIEITLANGEVVQRKDLFRTINPSQTVATEVMAPVSYLIAGNFVRFPVTSVKVDLKLLSDFKAAEIERISTVNSTYRRGETIGVKIDLRRHFGGDVRREVSLKIPETAQGHELLVMVGSASAFYMWDQERAPDKYRPRHFEDLVRLIQEYPSDEQLIVRLYGASRGVIIRGQEISSLPRSKWRVLSSGITGGANSNTAGLVLDEVVLNTGEVILGGNYVRVQLER
jgi:hypothetical protein